MDSRIQVLLLVLCSQLLPLMLSSLAGRTYHPTGRGQILVAVGKESIALIHYIGRHERNRALNSNSFTGPIPPSIGNLSKLSWLDLSDNKLDGSIPVSSGATPGLDMLLKAKHLRLDRNSLSGPIPSNLNNLTSVSELDLRNNRLNGTLDIGTSSSSNLTFNLQNNSISDFNQTNGYNVELM
ncbi:hypothetical protein RJ639_035248 [Escallonia herrerae]|uniref:Uncharacterized protein n=1 Tax=Escallonia herrerae TaxID=1293975 RepID=A0AA88WQ04_9ASTE|nr:hypothetical protein RJ639_035248 [Escallonia herrerae]